MLPLRPDCGCLSFSLRMRAVWRHDVFTTRVIRQKNDIDTLYTLHTSRGSNDAVLTNEKLPRVASRRTIRPYLVAARKRYSEADAGPGAEAGAGFRGRSSSVRPGSGRVHQHTTLGSRPAPGTPSEKRSAGTRPSHKPRTTPRKTHERPKSRQTHTTFYDKLA
eukprot:scaffold44365_cov91-Phaeocystis_antarctica.AAC.4